MHAASSSLALIDTTYEATEARRLADRGSARIAPKPAWPRLVPLHPPEPTLDRAALVERGLPIARRLAFRLVRRLPPSVDVGDLIGAAHEGLLRAAAIYDPAYHPCFEPYAEVRIRGAMLDELRAQDRMTRRGRSRLRTINAKQEELTRALGRTPEDAEIAQHLEMSVAEYRTVTRTLARGSALSYGGEIDPDTIAHSDDGDPASQLAQQEQRDALVRAIAQLPTRHARVLRLYYLDERTQSEIGAELGVTESRVCQILNDAVGKLRAQLGVTDAPKGRRPRAQQSVHAE